MEEVSTELREASGTSYISELMSNEKHNIGTQYTFENYIQQTPNWTNIKNKKIRQYTFQYKIETYTTETTYKQKTNIAHIE